MIYVFDTNSFHVLKNFYPDTFAKFWDDFDALTGRGEVASVEEVYNEAKSQIDSPHLLAWIERNRSLFTKPTEDEMRFVAQIFAVKHFQQLVSRGALLRGGHVADPWIIARAKALDGVVVTEEKNPPNAGKIPNVCDHFGIQWTNVQGFLVAKGWKY